MLWPIKDSKPDLPILLLGDCTLCIGATLKKYFRTSMKSYQITVSYTKDTYFVLGSNEVIMILYLTSLCVSMTIKVSLNLLCY